MEFGEGRLKMSSFNISGCCTLRDTFAFRENSEHDVVQFLQFSSPVTWFDFITAPPQKITLEDLSELFVDGILKNNFTKKCVVTDYNRLALKYFQGRADYWIFDFPEMVIYGLIKQTTEEGIIHYFTATGRVLKKNKDNKCFLDVLPGKKEQIAPLSYLTDNKIEKVIADLYNWVVYDKNYTVEQVVLVRTINALEYCDGKVMQDYSNRKKLENENILLEKIYDVFERYFAGCHVIRFPENIYGEIPHKWGLHPLHYCKEAYDYLYGMIDLISKGENTYSSEYFVQVYEKLFRAKREVFELQTKLQKEYMANIKLSTAISSIKKQTMFINESIREIKVPLLKLEVHFSNDGWITLSGIEKQSYKNDKGRQIEGVKLSVLDDAFNGSIFYAAKVNYRRDWTNTYSNGMMVGTTGKKMPLNGIKIWLDDVSAKRYSVLYKVYTSTNELMKGQDGSTIELVRGVMVFLEVWMKYRM